MPPVISFLSMFINDSPTVSALALADELAAALELPRAPVIKPITMIATLRAKRTRRLVRLREITSLLVVALEATSIAVARKGGRHTNTTRLLVCRKKELRKAKLNLFNFNNIYL